MSDMKKQNAILSGFGSTPPRKVGIERGGFHLLIEFKLYYGGRCYGEHGCYGNASSEKTPPLPGAS